MKKLFFAILCGAGLLSCNQMQTGTKTDNEAVLKEAKTATASFIESLSKNDGAAIKAALSQSSDFSVIMNENMFNRDEFLAMADEMMPNIEKQTFENMKEKYVILDQQSFIYIYTCLNKMTDKAGVVTTIDPISSSYTFQKEAEGWKIIHMHETWSNMKIDSSMVKNDKVANPPL